VRQELKFDLDMAKNLIDSFSAVTGICCRLYSTEGECLYAQKEHHHVCSLCRELRARTEKTPQCAVVHWYGPYQAERFGGTYTYVCPNGIPYFSSPIIVEGKVAGSLVGGPILMTNIEDDLAGNTEAWLNEADERIQKSLEYLPQVEPERVKHLSDLLFASSVCISDSSSSMFYHQSLQRQQKEIHTAVCDSKQNNGLTAYPIEKEKALMSAVAEGNEPKAKALLNEILAHILFASGNHLELIHVRVQELLVVLSRSAIYAGADVEEILALNCSYLEEIEHMQSLEEICFQLSNILSRFINLVCSMSEIKHKDVVYQVTDFIRQNYQRRITLEEAAACVHLSPCYFSRMFKEEMGVNFTSYLNTYRISQSKMLLLSDNMTLSEVSELTGFEDPAYFSRVFKRVSGLTPGKYRECKGRSNLSRERLALFRAAQSNI